MNRIPVYYHAVVEDDIAIVITTAKDYFDENRYIDEGATKEYYRIAEAMEKCGALETSASTFEIYPADDLDTIINEMTALGFDMEENPDIVASPEFWD